MCADGSIVHIFLRCSITGSALGWIDIFQDIRKHTEPEGLEYVGYWISQVKHLDQVLRKGDLLGVAAIFRD